MSHSALGAKLFVPAAVVPMTTQLGGRVGHHHEMEGTGLDDRLAPGADIRLAGGIGLDGSHRHLEVTPACHGSPADEGPDQEDESDEDRHHDHGDVEHAVLLLAEGVETHSGTVHVREVHPDSAG